VATFSTRCESPGVDPWTCQGRPQRDMLDHHFRVAPTVASTQIETMPLPRWVEPQLAKLVEKAPTGPQWVHETKFDGYRMAARIECGKVQLLTRSGLDWTAPKSTSAEEF